MRDYFLDGAAMHGMARMLTVNEASNQKRSRTRTKQHNNTHWSPSYSVLILALRGCMSKAKVVGIIELRQI